ncbi:MAG: hypothetical protein A3E07_02930 [Candidatus Wildermuthbacteria bacterium RIFCSPHIGHO2_12_FULL_45_9]|nr:MAG: hypothetical protein A3E07_02930 [Candidatus Wildermuthbacteria bacterium RIFCSPHIGHO2_12_FULL_45_9]
MMMYPPKRIPERGFTLIELLVVIAIIGLLASIVTVSLSSSQDRAKQAKIESFASQVHHALAADAVGIWKFEENGITVADISGNKINGSLSNAAARQSDAQCGLGFGGCLNLADTYSVGFGDPVSLRIQKEITISAWIRTSGDTTSGGGAIVSKYVDGNNFWYQLAVGGTAIFGTVPANYIAFAVSSGTVPNANANIVVSPASIADGKWHHVVGTFKPNDMVRLYIDGQLVDGESTTLTTIGATSTAAVSVKIGNSNYPGTFNGFVDEVGIYARTLTAGDVGYLYAQGLKKLQIAGEL